MENRKPLKVLVTAGGTRVKIDAIRSIVNGSSGRFGTEIAKSFDRILREHKDYCKDRIIFLGTRSCDISFLCDITRFDLCYNCKLEADEDALVKIRQIQKRTQVR